MPINHSKKICRGFTLIELMVVVSIISMLSSIVLASLGNARVSGRNGKIQSEVISLRSQIELSWDGAQYNDLTGNIAGVNGQSVALLDSINGPSHGASVNTVSVINDILTQSGTYYGGSAILGTGCANYNVALGYLGGAPNQNGLTVFTNNPADPGCSNFYKGTKYAIYGARIPVGSAGYFCVDSSGQTVDKRTGGIPAAPGTGPSCN